MALLKFELKEEHIKLLSHMKWGIDSNNSLYAKTENKTPYGGLSLVEDAGLILFGQPEGEFDPLSPYGPQYTEEQKEEIETLYNELDTANEIIHYLKTFEPGHYKAKWHDRHWKKYTPKDK